MIGREYKKEIISFLRDKKFKNIYKEMRKMKLIFITRHKPTDGQIATAKV